MTEKKKKKTRKKENFTEGFIKRIIANEKPDKGRIYFIDKKNSSLRLHLSSTGRTSFQFYMWDAIRKRPAAVGLGSYPTLTIDAARKLCENYAADVAAGADVAKQKAEAKAEPKLNDVFEEYLENHAKANNKSWLTDQQRYNNYIRDTIGKKRVSDIDVDTVKALRKRLLKQPKQRGEGTLSSTTVNRVLALLGSIWSVQFPSQPNPMKEVKKTTEHGRKRTLEVEEFPRFWKALAEETERPDVVDGIKLALFTGQRRSNVFGMKWSDLNLDRQVPAVGQDEDGKHIVIYLDGPEWTIPHEESKSGDNMTVELTEPVMEIIRNRKAAQAKQKVKSMFVFPAPNDPTKPLNDIRRPWSRIKNRAEIKNLRFHDLRHTCASWLGNLGASGPTIQAALNHKNLSTSEGYIHLQSSGVRQALETSQRAMAGLTEPESKIVNINGDK